MTSLLLLLLAASSLRSDVEKEYVKGLHKLVMKAKKTSKKCVG